MDTRREFINKIIMTGLMLGINRKAMARVIIPRKEVKEECCTVYRSVNGSPADNISKIVSMMGGINRIIGENDVVVIKPNVQWWNQGATNIAALRTFVDLIFGYPGGFKGEVVVAENCHRGPKPWTSMESGWRPVFLRNFDRDKNLRNYNELTSYLKIKYGNRVTTSYWFDVDEGNKRVFGPEEGSGYVYCDGTGGVPLISLNNGLQGDKLRKVIMSYPIFKTDNGTLVDFKNGNWKKGAYTEQPLRFINFSALNHHSNYCGATSAVKNYLGISDLSGGPDPHQGGYLTKDYFNFHSFPFDKWSSGPRPGMLGAEIGVFLKSIRKADLNITTAEWVGLFSRIETPVAHTRTVLACTDPVALDYHACKYLLYPNSGIPIHDPDNKKGPLREYLTMCAKEYDGIFDESYVGMKSYDFGTGKIQEDNNLVVFADKEWKGSNLKSIIKYLKLRLL